VLAKAKAFLASEETLAEVGLRLGLADAVRMSAAESAAGGNVRRSTLADTFEAVIAAVYLDQGLRTARRVVREALKPAIRTVERDEYHRDFKSELQERYQALQKATPHYKIVEETGADHDKTFVAQVYVGRKLLGAGAGKSKKQAEQEAARAALHRQQS
jgi:ribonuclease-3